MKLLIISFLLMFYIPIVQAGKVVKLGLLLFPPDVSIDYESNECVGRNVTITRELLAKYDIDVEVICSSPLRIYPMVINGDLDFTINIKSNDLLAKHVEFSGIPFRKITLNLYTHVKPTQSKMISAVTGYNYEGYRQKFSQEGFDFIDVPSTISALQLFLKEKTDYLVSYDSPVQNYMKKNNLHLNRNVTVTPLAEVDTFYAVALRSKHYAILMEAFSSFAHKHQLKYYQSAWP